VAKPSYRVTRLAAADYAEILRFTGRRWGRTQLAVYRRLLNDGLQAVANEPDRLNSRSCDELSPGLHSFHIGLVAAHPDPGRHILYYRVTAVGIVEIVRILHERMEASSHLT
jgi:toxin ParE1/3/4